MPRGGSRFPSPVNLDIAKVDTGVASIIYHALVAAVVDVDGYCSVTAGEIFGGSEVALGFESILEGK